MYPYLASPILWIAGAIALVAITILEFKCRRKLNISHSKFPPWFTSSMKQRFDELASQRYISPEALRLQQEVNSLIKGWIAQMDETEKALFLQWEEKCSQFETLEKERLYLQGIEDGLQLFSSRKL